jgi:hypothetical protein
MTFEQLDRSIDADSDSDDEMAEQAHLYKSKLVPLDVVVIFSSNSFQCLLKEARKMTLLSSLLAFTLEAKAKNNVPHNHRDQLNRLPRRTRMILRKRMRMIRLQIGTL